MKPLDVWLDDCVTSGFFAFHKPGRDRLLSTWFMASHPASSLILEWKEFYVSFFTKNTFDFNNKFNCKLLTLLSKIINKSTKTTRFWFSPMPLKLLKIYPQFIFHYMFEQLISNNSEYRIIWSKTPKVSADGPHNIANLGFFSDINEQIKKEIDEKKVPVYKLSWKYNHSKYSPSSILYYLLEARQE